MKTTLKIASYVLIILTITNCTSNKDCLKTITIPQFYIVSGTTYTYNTTQEVSCDFPDPATSSQIAPPKLENFTYNVNSFTFTPDTGNNTSRLQFEIVLNNPNNYAVEGFPYLTINSDGILFSTNYSHDATNSCNKLEANSSCTLTYNKENSLNTNLGSPKLFELTSVDYIITKKI
jgi:hypothetical protein